MPTSPSSRRGTKTRRPAAAEPPAPPRPLKVRLVLIGALAVIVVIVCVLPASLVSRFLPPSVRAEDFSGSVWHGSAGRLTVNGRPAGAVEWDVHPLALLGLRVATDLHWVKGAFVLDGQLDATRTQLVATNVGGGGPIQDLSDFGLGAGWHGNITLHIARLAADLEATGPALTSASGELDVADVSSLQVASGANLGGYELRVEPGTGTGMSAVLTDTGGPLAVNATLQLAMQTRTGLFSGTVKERADASPALRRQLDDLARLHARDAEGRLPVELEFTF